MATFSENPSFFDNFASTATSDLLTMQLAAGQPETSAGIITVTDPIAPDRHLTDRLGHFDPTIYNLREDSHLIKLLRVLLGGAGAGGLRKQMAVARMQNAFHGMHFLDLDRFYGALFGIRRTQAELQPDFEFNPYTDATTEEEWDDLHSRDASYRDRLVKFVRAIPYGASYIGLRSMIEALISADCEIYEAWNWIDEQDEGVMQDATLVYTWSFLESVGTFEQLERLTWGDWGGGTTPFIGRTGQRNRSEWIIHPKRPLTVDEQYQLTRVINTFKPVGTQFTVNNTGLEIHSPLAIRAVAASSEYWEVKSSVIPNANMKYNPYIQSKRKAITKSGVFDNPFDPASLQKMDTRRPAFSQYQGEEWSYNADVLTASSYTIGGASTTASDDELVIFPDGTTRTYQASDGLMTPASAESARLAADGIMTSGAYADSRRGVNLAPVVSV